MTADVEKDGPPKPKKQQPSDFTDIVGGCGCWQWQIFAIFFFATFPGAWHSLVMSFFAPDIDHWCSRPEQVIATNLSIEKWKKEIIPLEISEDGVFTFSQCTRYDIIDFNDTNSLNLGDNDSGWNFLHPSNRTISCKAWEYDESFYSSTVVNEWDLVCEREWLISLTKTVFMAGYLTSTLVLGQLSDKIGRRPVVMMSVIIFLISGIICAFSTSFIMFTVSRFFVALGASGIFTTGFVILMEVVGVEYRSLFGIAIMFGWSTGYVLLPGIAWFVRDWFWLQLALTLPGLALLSLWWLVPESPRWLMTQGKWEKAQDIIGQMAQKNGKEVNDIDTAMKKIYNKTLKAQKGEIQSGDMLDLFRTPGLRQKTLNLYFCWCVNSFIYYGLSYNTNELGGNPFLNFLVSGAVEFPAYALTILVIRKLGRRLPLMVTMVTGGVACILTIPVPHDMVWLRLSLTMFGKFCITASFAIAYVYTAEIFPTVVRNVGVGTSSTCARIGSMIAPFVKELGQATHTAVPLACYGGLSVASGLLVLLLPETNKTNVPDTLEEASRIGRKEIQNKPQVMENGNGHVIEPSDNALSNGCAENKAPSDGNASNQTSNGTVSKEPPEEILSEQPCGEEEREISDSLQLEPDAVADEAALLAEPNESGEPTISENSDNATDHQNGGSVTESSETRAESTPETPQQTNL